jgi:type I restriction enzyme S subunit
MMPNGWEKHPVGKICTSIVPGRNKPKAFNGSIPWVTTPEIKGKYIPSKSQQNYISTEVLKECGGKIVPSGAVVMAAVGELGLVAITSEEVVLNQQLHAFVCSDLVHNEYLAYWLSSQKTYMRSIASKTTIPYLNKTNCESVPVALPPRPEQRKIATILGTWDKAISTTERLIDNSKQQKKALMQQLLTGKKRLLDDSGKPFEGEWEEIKLGDVVLTGRGYAFKSTQYSESGYKIVRVTNVDSSGKIDLSDCVYIPDETAFEFKKYELYQDDVLLVMVGATVGKLGFVSKDTLPALLNQNMWSLRSKDSERLCQIFLRHVIYQVVAKYLLSQQGSARGFFTQKTFESVKFSIPTIKEQQKVASVLTNADKEIELLEQQLADLKQEKKALMQQLLTGKRRVIVDEKEVA